MRIRIPVVLAAMLAVCLSGCAYLRPGGTAGPDRQPPPKQAAPPVQQVKLARAVEALKYGDPDIAVKLLEEVCAEKGIPGVTDEALFRLTLLTIDSEPEQQNKIQPSLRLLGRLEKEYPDSPWMLQAAPLKDLLETLLQKLQSTQELRRQIKTFKGQNLNLSRENKELRLNIERLKNLDMELERKK